MRILLAEDDKKLGMILKAFLDSKGFVTTLCVNGEEALNCFSAAQFDFCLFDVTMPVMDGFTLARQIKSVSPATPIVFLTARKDQESVLEGFKIGADDYITKPFSIKDLTLHIDNIVENRERVRRVTQTAEAQQEESATRPPTPDEEFLKKATACVNAHIDDSDYDRDAFAADMGASASTLYNKLRALTGMNVSAFIRDIRLKTACRLAKENPHLRVSDIAYRVGFKDPKYFATSFKKEMGIQPKEYFEQLRTDDAVSATSPQK